MTTFRSSSKLAAFVAVIVGAAGSVGCGLEPIDDGGEGGDEIPAAVQQAFSESCATSVGCHDTGSALVVLAAGESGGILEGSGGTGVPFVTLGDLDNSYIAQKILGGSSIQGSPMPPSMQSANDDFNKAIIVGWIAGVEIGGGETGDTGDTDDTGGETGEEECFIMEPLPDTPTFGADIWPILETRCATSGCHADAFGPTMSDAAGAYANLVGIDSGDAGMNFIEPNQPENSYLWHKLVGTHLTVGGSGGTMPASGQLCLVEIQGIYRWIVTGAGE